MNKSTKLRKCSQKIFVDTISYSLYGTFKMAQIDTYSNLAIEELAKSVDNFAYEGDWVLNEIECRFDDMYDYYNSSLLLTWRGGTASYNKALRN